MIIDCHGHYTTAPAAHQGFRDAQLERLDDLSQPMPVPGAISDDEIVDSIETNQLRLMRERGIDLTVFSPKASGMEHHVTDGPTALAWARACNDLIHRVVELFPDDFAGVCQLPQYPGCPTDGLIAEVERCVNELGFVGCNLNPDPSGGWWTAAPVTHRYWFPLFEKLEELDVPAMIHVSASCNPNFHALGAHYLNADTSIFMQLLEGDLFSSFPNLRVVIPHGGGAVPYHWGRYEGLAVRLDRPPLREHLMGNVYFDSCVYHQPGIDLLLGVVGAQNVLFASEMLGAVRGDNPATGRSWDDTKVYVDAVELTDDDRELVYRGNALRVYPRLAQRIDVATT